jgi:hypothetical protein
MSLPFHPMPRIKSWFDQSMRCARQTLVSTCLAVTVWPALLVPPVVATAKDFDFSDPSYDKVKYRNFVPPEASTRLADGERKVLMRVDGNGSNKPDEYITMSRTISNPYLPVEPYVLIPRYTIGKNDSNAEIVHIGVPESPGFFRTIERLRCMAGDELLIQGAAGLGQRDPKWTSYSTYSQGVWKVSSEGAITPYLVKPQEGNMSFRPCGNLNACDTAHSEVWDRAEAFNSALNGAIEDKHGNVWLLNLKEPVGWAVMRFNKDGSDKQVLDKKFLFQDAPKMDDWMMPDSLYYDKVRDEVVFVHSYWGSGEGAMGIWRIKQNNEPREVLRFLTRSRGALTTPSPNMMQGRFSSIEYGFSVDPQGTIWFAAATMAQHYPSQAYQVIDSIKTLKKLPYSTSGEGMEERFRLLGRSTNKRTPTETESLGAPLGRQACFDSKGNQYFIGNYQDVLRRDAKTGRVTTWVK